MERKIKVQFAPMPKASVTTLLIFFAFTINITAPDYYTTTSNLNLRSGPGINHETVAVLKEGDTVKLLENTSGDWVKIQYRDKTGYSAKQFLTQIQVNEKVEPEESDTFIGILIFFVFIILSAVFFAELGRKYRSKSGATLLSFFFGLFGLQKFYLGRPVEGLFSILFCWTFIPLLVGFYDFVKLATMNEHGFNIKYNGRVFTTKQVSNDKKAQSNTLRNQPQAARTQIDPSIIDVTSGKFDVTVEKPLPQRQLHLEPPFWSHTYVYSYDELRNATKAQKEFYFYLKNKVIDGEFVDIKDNTNYAFVLYFDLLNEYRTHRDIVLLEEQFKLIGQICPKTKKYTLQILQEELRKRNDSYSIDKLNSLDDSTYQFEYGYSDYNPDLYKLGNQYKEKLNLNKQEVRWLNKFYNPSNVFTSIEGCCIATIKQYVFILKELDKRLKQKETTLVKEAAYFKERIKTLYTRKYNSEWGYYDTSYFNHRAEADLYLTVFKRIENSVREAFGHKRKVSSDLPFADNRLTEEFELRLGSVVNELIEKYKKNIEDPDLETQIELNAQNVNRWKDELKDLQTSFKPEEIEIFIERIARLEEANVKNPNIEHVFFEASKFIAKYDRIQSLKYYAKYIYYDLKSRSFDNRGLTKTVQRSLFKNEEQINDFKKIISDLITTADIEKALDDIPKIFERKRRTIKLDKSEITQVEQRHKGTVELLNEFLEEKNHVDDKILTVDGSGSGEVEIVTIDKKTTIFKPEINLNNVQEQLIENIVANSFVIHQSQVDEYAIRNGIFKNQLIDSINEVCAEYLDGEALIEEDDENYVIEKSYYKEIVL